MTKVTAANGEIIHTLEELNQTLAEGNAAYAYYDTEFNGTQEVKLQWQPEAPRFGAAGIHIHDTPARSMKQLIEYLNGDAHDRSKIQFSTGSNIKQVF